jgi:hypothetical protein
MPASVWNVKQKMDFFVQESALHLIAEKIPVSLGGDFLIPLIWVMKSYPNVGNLRMTTNSPKGTTIP